MFQFYVKIVNHPIDTQSVFEKIQDNRYGAQVVFFGSVRDLNCGKNVKEIEYDAFIPLAEKTLGDLCFEVREKFGDEMSLVVIHRIGKLALKEISVAIGVGSVHRDKAYEASRYLIEQLKKRAPIWKKEIYDSGETEWLKGNRLGAAAAEVGSGVGWQV